MATAAADTASFSFEVDGLDEELRVVGFRASEGISRLFQVELELASEEPAIAFDDVVDKTASLAIEGEDGPRYLHGVIRRFEQGGQGNRFTHYRASLVPKLWRLRNRHNCRIFQNQTVEEIIKAILKELGLESNEYEFHLEGDHPTWEYCVQYRETDLGFIQRLMEEEGIFYYFAHDDEKHVFVVGDNASGYRVIEGEQSIPFHPPTGEVPDVEHVTQFSYAERMSPGGVVLRDFNFKKPGKKPGEDLEVTETSDSYDDLSVYDYPGNYADADRGAAVAQLRREALEAARQAGSGACNSPRLMAGHQFALAEHPRDSFNQKYLLTEVVHEGREPQALEEESGGAGGASYLNDFECIPAEVTYRPAQHTPKPLVDGPQTAVVVGPDNEEIYTDEFGRVKVKFPWDRASAANETSSCWIRVSQAWAGSGWGAMFIPRIGQEVIVDFLEGDPDRPVITGRLYHGTNRPPYKPDEAKTTSTIKSKSSKDADGFNEIRLEDKKDEEQIFIHAQRNHDLRVKNTRFETVGNNAHVNIKKNKFEHIENNRNALVDNDHLEEIKNDRNLKVGGKEAVEIGGSHSMTVKGDVTEVYRSNHSEQTTNNYYLKAMGVVIEAMTGLTLKCGGTNIVLDPSGVTLSGPTITVDGSMVRIASGPGSSPSSGKAGSAVPPAAPEKPKPADTGKPGEAQQLQAGPEEDETPHKKDENKSSWVEVEMVDEDDNPVPGEKYKIELPDGSVKTGTLDENGLARVDGIDPGTCKVTFPELDKDAWEKA